MRNEAWALMSWCEPASERASELLAYFISKVKRKSLFAKRASCCQAGVRRSAANAVRWSWVHLAVNFFFFLAGSGGRALNGPNLGFMNEPYEETPRSQIASDQLTYLWDRMGGLEMLIKSTCVIVESSFCSHFWQVGACSRANIESDSFFERTFRTHQLLREHCKRRPPAANA